MKKNDPLWSVKRSEKNLRKYGLTMSEYEALLAKQGGTCAICRVSQDEYKAEAGRMMAVDHCHVTGKVRGVLCHMCNTAIGKLKDDVTLLRSAIAYLES